MREVKYTKRFQRDYRREKSGRHSQKLDALLMEVVNQLAVDTPLPRRNFDHPLSGEWNDHRDCHVRPDLVLIYRKPMTTASNLCALARIVSLEYNNGGGTLHEGPL
jgi:mRNA interferase YafQ